MRGSTKVLVCMVLLGLMATLTGAAGPGRSYVAGRYGIELDGVFMGFVQSAEGGHAYSEVVSELVGAERVARKHIGNVKYEEITIKVGANMPKAFYQWLQETMAGQSSRKNGAIIAADYNYRETGRLTFTNALITEIGFPALDASSKDPAYITITISPEMTRRAKPTGKQLPAAGGGKQKQWLPANFRLRIDGLEKSTSRVSKIEALTVKQKVATDMVGEMRDYEIEPTSLEMPNLVVTFAEHDADAWYDWADSFIIDGDNGEEKEKNGTLEFLAPNLKEVLFSLNFRHLGIFKLAPEKTEAGSEQIRRIKAEMYVEDMKLSLPAATALPVPQATPAVPVIVPDPVPADQIRSLERGVK
jgi:phage tail-like protein